MNKSINQLRFYFSFLTLFAGMHCDALAVEPLKTLKISSGKVEFYAIGKPSMLKIHGTGKTIEGTMNVKNTEYSGHFTVKMDDFSSGLSLRDTHTKEKIFEVDKFPVAELTLKPMSAKSSEKTKFVGLMKFHGVEKEVQGDATLNLSDNKVGFESTFNILLTDYNIQPPEFAGMKINNEVRIEVSGEAIK